MKKRIAILVCVSAMVYPGFILGQAVRFYSCDVRVPLLMGKTRLDVEHLLGKPIRTLGTSPNEVSFYEKKDYSVRVRYQNGVVIYLDNPDVSDD